MKNKPNKESCFVIMPFGGYFDDYYQKIYVPAIEKVGLLPKRADDIYRPSEIVNDIWNYTKESRIVLADLTGKNANVFYELGLAHALAKPAVLVTNTIDDVPFDLRSLRVIVYNKNVSNWGEELSLKIERALKETLDSKLPEVLPTFLDIYESKKTEISISELDFLELKKGIDLIKNEIRKSDKINIYDMRGGEIAAVISWNKERGIPDDQIVERMNKIYGLQPQMTLKIINEVI